MPFAPWASNDLRNLLHTGHEVNADKSAKLSLAQLLSDRRLAVMEDWAVLRAADRMFFDRQAAQFLGSPPTDSPGRADALFERFLEAVEVTALQREVER